MSTISNLELPTELKRRIERVAKAREEEPATLLSSAIDSLLSIEEAQISEVRRRDATDTGEISSNEEALAKLESLRPSRGNPLPK
jgi:predicted transcriptional regulator